MSRMPVAASLALAVLALHASTAVAQIFPLGFPPGDTISRPGRAIEGEAQMCQGTAGGSRMRSNCDDRETPPSTALQEAARVPVPATALASGPRCEATTLTEYVQRNTVAQVSGSVSVK